MKKILVENFVMSLIVTVLICLVNLIVIGGLGFLIDWYYCSFDIAWKWFINALPTYFTYIGWVILGGTIAFTLACTFCNFQLFNKIETEDVL